MNLSRNGFRTAVRELNAFFAPIGEEGSAGVLGGLDVGYDAVLFYGPTLTGRMEVTDGMVLLPFGQVRAFVEESVVDGLAPPGSWLHGWESVGAAVRPFRWKPEFRRAGDLRNAERGIAGAVLPGGSDIPGTACRVACGAGAVPCGTVRLHRPVPPAGSLAWSTEVLGSTGVGRRTGSTGSNRLRH